MVSRSNVEASVLNTLSQFVAGMFAGVPVVNVDWLSEIHKQTGYSLPASKRWNLYRGTYELADRTMLLSQHCLLFFSKHQVLCVVLGYGVVKLNGKCPHYRWKSISNPCKPVRPSACCCRVHSYVVCSDDQNVPECVHSSSYAVFYHVSFGV